MAVLSTRWHKGWDW